ncbi:hypothetical protein Misp03_67300 [Microbispora sp. NBRC 16548]|nr:hypothetical protein Misp03_67300 [Microbispora sp. NBRC 16548]
MLGETLMAQLYPPQSRDLSICLLRADRWYAVVRRPAAQWQAPGDRRPGWRIIGQSAHAELETR